MTKRDDEWRAAPRPPRCAGRRAAAGSGRPAGGRRFAGLSRPPPAPPRAGRGSCPSPSSLRSRNAASRDGGSCLRRPLRNEFGAASRQSSCAGSRVAFRLRCMRPGKQWRELAPARFPGRLQRSEAEWKAIRDPAPEAAAKRRRTDFAERRARPGGRILSRAFIGRIGRHREPEREQPVHIGRIRPPRAPPCPGTISRERAPVADIFALVEAVEIEPGKRVPYRKPGCGMR